MVYWNHVDSVVYIGNESKLDAAFHHMSDEVIGIVTGIKKKKKKKVCA